MRAIPLAVLLLAVPLLGPATASPVVDDITLTVGGEPAHGLRAMPVGECRGVVVLAHGYGHQAESHRGHLARLASLGFAAVAMDYRGPQAGFPLAAGAADTLAATADTIALCPGKPVDLYSVSMGTAVAGMVLAEAPGTFRYWVSNEGLSMLQETWAEAKAVCPGVPFGCVASSAIENETGGTPATAAAAYVERSAALRVPEFGIAGAVLTHGLNDGLVPYDQGRELLAALRANGVPSDFHTVVRGEVGGEGTTITGYGGVNVDGLAGHGTESNDAHTLTKLSFALLEDVIEGRLVPGDREFVVDRDAGTLP